MKEEAPRQDLFEKIGLAPLEGVGMAVRKEWVILMREMDVSEVTNAVRELCVAANKTAAGRFNTVHLLLRRL